MILSVVLALFVGLVVATIGAWKDTAWEPFCRRTFFRSPVVTVGWSIALVLIWPKAPVVLIALSAAALERLSVEIWKGTLRRRPSKFARADRDTHWLRQRLQALPKIPDGFLELATYGFMAPLVGAITLPRYVIDTGNTPMMYWTYILPMFWGGLIGCPITVLACIWLWRKRRQAAIFWGWVAWSSITGMVAVLIVIRGLRIPLHALLTFRWPTT